MRLINFQKDNIIRLPRDPSGMGWPTCYKCWQPVEEYAIVETGMNFEVIQARCSHKTSKVDTEAKRVTMRRRWSNDKKQNERSKLVFFVPSAQTPIENDPGV